MHFLLQVSFQAPSISVSPSLFLSLSCFHFANKCCKIQVMHGYFEQIFQFIEFGNHSLLPVISSSISVIIQCHNTFLLIKSKLPYLPPIRLLLAYCHVISLQPSLSLQLCRWFSIDLIKPYIHHHDKCHLFFLSSYRTNFIQASFKFNPKCVMFWVVFVYVRPSISAPLSKNAVSANIRHSRYFH